MSSLTMPLVQSEEDGRVAASAVVHLHTHAVGLGALDEEGERQAAARVRQAQQVVARRLHTSMMKAGSR